MKFSTKKKLYQFTAELSDKIYSKDDFRDFCNLNGFNEQRRIDRKAQPMILISSPFIKAQVRACIIFDGETIFVIYKGTNSTGEWLSNVTYYTEPFFGTKKAKPFSSNGKCVAGFHRNTSELYKDVRRKVNNFLQMNPNADIHFTGHSLGAGMALLSCSDFLNNKINGYQNVKSLITFGSPKIVNGAFKKHFDKLKENQKLDHKRFATYADGNYDIVTTNYLGMTHIPRKEEKLKCNKKKNRFQIHDMKQYIKSLKDY